MNLERVIRFRIHEKLLRRYRSLCAELGISAPKQTTAIIREFVEIQEENIKQMKEDKYEKI
jgi:hypothetical protein